jgi:hypothetical protein
MRGHPRRPLAVLSTFRRSRPSGSSCRPLHARRQGLGSMGIRAVQEGPQRSRCRRACPLYSLRPPNGNEVSASAFCGAISKLTMETGLRRQTALRALHGSSQATLSTSPPGRAAVNSSKNPARAASTYGRRIFVIETGPLMNCHRLEVSISYDDRAAPRMLTFSYCSDSDRAP